MITLQNTSALPQALGLMQLSIVSESEVPSVSLSLEDAKVEERGEWKISTTEGKQLISCFIGGKPFKMTSAKLPLAYIVAGPEGAPVTAYKVVVEVETKTGMTSAFEKGDKSREFVTVSLNRVVEVWGSPAKLLWSEKTAGNGAAKPGATLEANGRIQKAEGVRV